MDTNFIINSILLVVCILLLAWFIPALLYLKKGMFKRFYHDRLGWHRPDESKGVGFDGCSIHAHCKYCGKDIMMDSQGNWF